MNGSPSRTMKLVGERGNVLLLSLLLVTLLIALATAHFATVQKNSRQSGFVNDLRELRRYAESGVTLALHELSYEVGGADGKIGTESWTPSNDLGRDGRPSTQDEGEGDGIPTPGEPGLYGLPIGPSVLGDRLLVSTSDTSWSRVKRVISSAFNSRNYACVEVYVLSTPNRVPGVGAVYVQPEVLLNLNGSSFLVDGHDTNPDGSVGPESAVYGITTTTGDPPGSNASDIRDTVPSAHSDQITGLGANPSVGESGALEFDSVFNAFKAVQTDAIAPGTYANPSLGHYAPDCYKVTYCGGNLNLTGNGKGAGVLIVEGSLTLTGRFDFIGIIIVRGDVKLTGGGSGIHLYGSLMIGETLLAYDPDMDFNIYGTSDIFYSSVGIGIASSFLGSTYSVLYWNDIK